MLEEDVLPYVNLNKKAFFFDNARTHCKLWIISIYERVGIKSATLLLNSEAAAEEMQIRWEINAIFAEFFDSSKLRSILRKMFLYQIAN
jgi:hypothetical protein